MCSTKTLSHLFYSFLITRILPAYPPPCPSHVSLPIPALAHALPHSSLPAPTPRPSALPPPSGCGTRKLVLAAWRKVLSEGRKGMGVVGSSQTRKDSFRLCSKLCRRLSLSKFYFVDMLCIVVSLRDGCGKTIVWLDTTRVRRENSSPHRCLRCCASVHAVCDRRWRRSSGLRILRLHQARSHGSSSSCERTRDEDPGMRSSAILVASLSGAEACTHEPSYA